MAPDSINSTMLDLIDAYINDKLDSNQKLEFFEQVKKDEKLKTLLVRELELRRQIKQLKIHIDDVTKARVLRNVCAKAMSQPDIQTEIVNYFVSLALKMIVPGPILPYINKLKRSCI